MARKETITKTMIQESAFDLLCEEGMENVTARKLAVKIGCSTQPIFRLYDNMDCIHEELFEKASAFFNMYYEHFPQKYETPFVNLGLAYIHFAETESKLFSLLFLSRERHGKELYEILNGKNEVVKKELIKAAAQGCQDPQGLFMKMWIFINGAACMTITGDYDLSTDDTVKLLTENYHAFLSRG